MFLIIVLQSVVPNALHFHDVILHELRECFNLHFLFVTRDVIAEAPVVIIPCEKSKLSFSEIEWLKATHYRATIMLP